MAGYSKRSLPEKLGIKEGAEIGIVNAPPDYDQTLTPLPEGVLRAKKLRAGMAFIHFFTKERSELSKRFPELKNYLAPKGILWISWPKGSSKVKTDLNENIVRDIGVANGMVDIKVCAVDEIWSGLRFAFRR
ncbi:DUF3052 domain-containing protein [bacterium]|nr:DUF3052 domain-containing protein [bacterium]MCI0606525.1 DUF3052 domain-containing protein [bacterium]